MSFETGLQPMFVAVLCAFRFSWARLVVCAAAQCRQPQSEGADCSWRRCAAARASSSATPRPACALTPLTTVSLLADNCLHEEAMTNLSMMCHNIESNATCAGCQGLLVCGLPAVSTRAPELHALLLLAAELRALTADARRHLTALTKSLVSARRAFTKLFLHFPGSTATDPETSWAHAKQGLRLKLQVCSQSSACACRHVLPLSGMST